MTWPPGFFDRQDPRDDADFYAAPRFVTHIDAGAIQAVSDLYDELGVPDGRVLDLMSSWVSHLSRRPDGGLVLLGMNAAELAANPLAESYVLADLNRDPVLPFADASFDAVTCCVSIDYLVAPVEVLGEVTRVLRPGGVVVLTFSNRCFPTKAIRGWLASDDATRLAIVRAYVEQAGGFGPVSAQRRTPERAGGDPLYGVWARRLSDAVGVITLADMAQQEFVSLTTYRRSGAAVSVAVWIAPDTDGSGTLLVTTTERSGKVKRLRHDPRVELRPCDRRGEVAPDAPVVSAQAEIVDSPEEVRRLREAIRAKYGERMKITAADQGVVDPAEPARVILRITRADPDR